jgi:hypothetical protein
MGGGSRDGGGVESRGEGGQGERGCEVGTGGEGRRGGGGDELLLFIATRMPAIVPPTTPSIATPINAFVHTGCLLKLTSAAPPVASVPLSPPLSSSFESLANGGALEKVTRGLQADFIFALFSLPCLPTSSVHMCMRACVKSRRKKVNVVAELHFAEAT